MERRNKRTNDNIRRFPTDNRSTRKSTQTRNTRVNSTSSRNRITNQNNSYPKNPNRKLISNTSITSFNREPYKRSLKNKIKKRKNRNNVIIAKTFTFFIFFLIISYFGVSVYKSLSKKPVTYQVVKNGTIDNQKLSKGVIIRNEQVYKASKEGSLEFYKLQNEKVRKGELVASIKDLSAIENTEQELDEINKKILDLQENRNELSLFFEDVKKVDMQIQTILENEVYEFAKNNISAIYQIQNNIQKKIDVRNQMLLSETGGSISELASKRSLKEQTINANTNNIFINEGGILSYYTDGLEDTFSFKNLDAITPEQTKMQGDKSDELLNYKVQVLTDEPIFKVVTNNEFYIAANIKTDYINLWKENEFRNIYINNQGKFIPQEVKIEKIELGEKVSYVLMKSTKNILDFIDKRSITFEVSKPKEGFKIQNSAIVEKNLLKIPSYLISENTVTKKTESGNKKLFIEVSETNEVEGFSYVPIKYGELAIGDILINPQNNSEFILNDISTTKGIYVVNSGVYKFVKINLDNSISNQEFTILDPNINSSIKIYDRFIPDAKSIIKEQPIYN